MPSAPSKARPMDDASANYGVGAAPTTTSKLKDGAPRSVNRTASDANSTAVHKQSLLPSAGTNATTTGNITVTLDNSNATSKAPKLNKPTKFKSLTVDGVALVPKTPVPGLAAALQASGVRVVSSPSDLHQPSQPPSIPIPLNASFRHNNAKPLPQSLPLPPPPPTPPPLTPNSAPILRSPPIDDPRHRHLNVLPSPTKGKGASSPKTRLKSANGTGLDGHSNSKLHHDHNTRRSSVAHKTVLGDHNPSSSKIVLNPPKLPNLNPPPLPPTHPSWSSQSLKTSTLYSPNSSNPNLSLPVFSSPVLSASPSPASSPTSVSAAISNISIVEKLLQRKMKSLQSELREIESTIEVKEHEYITETWSHGNVIRGWDNFLRRAERSEKAAAAASSNDGEAGGQGAGGHGGVGHGSGSGGGASKKASMSSRKARVSDHIFSLSSSTSKVRKEHPDVSIPKRPSVITKRKKKRG